MNKNMPLRGFLYFSQLYQKYLAKTKKDMNRSSRIEIPAPNFIVFYNELTKSIIDLLYGNSFASVSLHRGRHSSRISMNLLDGFFRRQKAEVIGMILEEFNEEIYKQNVREDGYMEGLSDGQKQKALESAENLFREEIPLEIISRCIGLPLE